MPLPPDAPLAAIARGLQLIGIYLCLSSPGWTPVPACYGGAPAEGSWAPLSSWSKLRRETMSPRGRDCPLTYRHQPEVLAGPAQLSADTLYMVGGRLHHWGLPEFTTTLVW